MACTSYLRSKSIFYQASNGKYCLNKNLSLHFYSSDAPSGDANKTFNNTTLNINQNKEYLIVNFLNSNNGALSVKSSLSVFYFKKVFLIKL